MTVLLVLAIVMGTGGLLGESIVWSHCGGPHFAGQDPLRHEAAHLGSVLRPALLLAVSVAWAMGLRP